MIGLRSQDISVCYVHVFDNFVTWHADTATQNRRNIWENAFFFVVGGRWFGLLDLIVSYFVNLSE